MLLLVRTRKLVEPPTKRCLSSTVVICVLRPTFHFGGSPVHFATLSRAHTLTRMQASAIPLRLHYPDLLPLPDIVLRDADLLDVFEPLLRHKDKLGEPLFVDRIKTAKTEWHATLNALVSHLSSRSSLRIGVIIDETQKITEAVEERSLKYFKEGWYGWQYSPGRAFVRMDIASSHGA